MNTIKTNYQTWHQKRFWNEIIRTTYEVSTWKSWKTGGYQFSMETTICPKCNEGTLRKERTCCSERRSGWNSKLVCQKCNHKILIEKRDLKR